MNPNCFCSLMAGTFAKLVHRLMALIYMHEMFVFLCEKYVFNDLKSKIFC